MKAQYDVVIVGAGIAGSALACALAEKKASGSHFNRVALVEARTLPTGWPPVSDGLASYDLRVSALTAASCAFLSDLGVWPSIVDKRVCAFEQMQVWDAEGTGKINFDAAEVEASELGFIVENRLLVAALINQLRQNKRVDIFDGQAVSNIQLTNETSEEPNIITLENAMQLSCDLVVGADGAHSKLRQQMQIPVRSWDYGQDAIVCTVEVAKPHNNTAMQCFTRNGPVAFLPLSGDSENSGRLCSIVWSQQREYAEYLMQLNDESFSNALVDALESRLGEIKTLSSRQSFPLRQSHAVQYVVPGFALVADAAHTLHPLAGQGINLGLGDIKKLVEVIAEATGRGLKAGDLSSLKRYQRQRKTDNLIMMAAVEGFKRLYQPSPPVLHWGRNVGMNWLNQQQWLKDQILKYAMGVDFKSVTVK